MKGCKGLIFRGFARLVYWQKFEEMKGCKISHVQIGRKGPKIDTTKDLIFRRFARLDIANWPFSKIQRQVRNQRPYISKICKVRKIIKIRLLAWLRQLTILTNSPLKSAKYERVQRPKVWVSIGEVKPVFYFYFDDDLYDRSESKVRKIIKIKILAWSRQLTIRNHQRPYFSKICKVRNQPCPNWSQGSEKRNY